MAKNKKAADSSSVNKKKATEASTKKPVKKMEEVKLEKTEIISRKIGKINKSFESLIKECQEALNNLQFANA